jgi:hypothetical protein
MNYSAKEIATMLNLLVSDETITDKAKLYYESLNSFVSEMTFETTVAEFLFKSSIDSEFSQMENYSMVFTEVIYK